MFCLTLKPDHLNKIKNFNYLPVGLGEETFSEEWFRDNKGINISDKNNYRCITVAAIKTGHVFF